MCGLTHFTVFLWKSAHFLPCGSWETNPSLAFMGSPFTIWPLIYISQQPFEDHSSETHKVTCMITVTTTKHSSTLRSLYTYLGVPYAFQVPLFLCT